MRTLQIYVMDADGGNQEKLTNSDFSEWQPSWSPDGKWIAFTSSGHWNVAGGVWQIHVMDVHGENQRNISNDRSFDEWEPSWSPDGRRIAFVSRLGMGTWKSV